MSTDGPTPSPTFEGDAAGQGSTVKYQTSTTNEVDVEALLIAGGIIGGLFVIFIIVACRLWRKHEKVYSPIYEKRKKEMLKERESKLKGNGMYMREHDVEYHEDALQLGRMEDKGGSSVSSDGYRGGGMSHVDFYGQNGI